MSASSSTPYAPWDRPETRALGCAFSSLPSKEFRACDPRLLSAGNCKVWTTFSQYGVRAINRYACRAACVCFVAAVGLERGWREREQPDHSRTTGIRTFAYWVFWAV